VNCLQIVSQRQVYQGQKQNHKTGIIISNPGKTYE
jgi:hypothetical protein